LKVALSEKKCFRNASSPSNLDNIYCACVWRPGLLFAQNITVAFSEL
jgi:hypothetical protein